MRGAPSSSRWRFWLPATAGLVVAGALTTAWLWHETPGWVESWLENWTEQDVGGDLDLEVAEASLAHLQAPHAVWQGQGWELEGREARVDYFWLPGQDFELRSVEFGKLALTLDLSQPLAWPQPKRPPEPEPAPAEPDEPLQTETVAPRYVEPGLQGTGPQAATTPPPSETEPTPAAPTEPSSAPAMGPAEPWPVPTISPAALPQWDPPTVEAVAQGFWDFQLDRVSVPEGLLRLERGEANPLEWPWQLQWSDNGLEIDGALAGEQPPAEFKLNVQGVRPEWAEVSLSLQLADRESWQPWLEAGEPWAQTLPAGLDWRSIQFEALARYRPGELPRAAVLLEGDDWMLDGAGLDRVVVAAEGHDWNDLQLNGAARTTAYDVAGWHLPPADVILKYPAPRYLKVEVPTLTVEQDTGAHVQAAFRAFLQPPWTSAQPQAEWELAVQEGRWRVEEQLLGVQPFSVFGRAVAGGWRLQASPVQFNGYPDWTLADLKGTWKPYRDFATLAGTVQAQTRPVLNWQARATGLAQTPQVQWSLQAPGEQPTTDLQGAVTLQEEATQADWQGRLGGELVETLRAFLPADWRDLQAQGALAFGPSQVTLGETTTGDVRLQPQLTQLGSKQQGWQLHDLTGNVRLASQAGFWLPQGPETALQLGKITWAQEPDWDVRDVSLTVPEAAAPAQLEAVLYHAPTSARALGLTAEADWQQGYSLDARLHTFPRGEQAPLDFHVQAQAALLPLLDHLTLQGGGPLASLGPLKYHLGPAWSTVRWAGELDVSADVRRQGLLDYRGTAHLQLTDGQLTWAEERTSSGIDAALDLIYENGKLRSDGVQTITVQELKQGDEVLQNVELQVDLTQYPTLRVVKFVGDWRGGQVSLKPFAVDVTDPDFETVVTFQNVEAQPIVSAFSVEVIELQNGRLQGQLPVRYQRGRWSSQGGQLTVSNPAESRLRFTDRQAAEKYLDLGDGVPKQLELEPRVVEAAMQGLQVEYLRLNLWNPQTPRQPVVMEFRLSGKTEELELEGIIAKIKFNSFGEGVAGDATDFEATVAAILDALQPPGLR
ncbi:MAG: hypothetical protein E1N59_2272 [Puniceicoccaceae bacterium 5H]|nr:MAG: hypothetical protein E1N59_2272 [Puniceicoccaceae bacterium 5H]